MRPRSHRLLRVAVVVAGLSALAGTALAHGGSLRGAAPRDLAVPTWLFLLTGGGVVGASFLLASFATDREFIRGVHEWSTALPAPADALALAARAIGLAGLLAVVVVGLVGPSAPARNLAILLVWVGWWAGLAMAAYLVGDAWPAVNPFRTLAALLPSRDRPFPDGWGAWPSVAGLLALVWLEVVSPVGGDPRALALVVLGYGAVAVAGSVLFSPEAWFGRVDPVSRVFRFYGRVAPLHWDGGLRLRLPGAGLDDDFLEGSGEVAFVVALLWVTSYDGLVSTAPWRDVATAVVGAGVPAAALYPFVLVAGFGVFYWLFRLAVRSGRARAETLRSEAELARRFAPSLLAIAAGYHLAHYLTYFLSLSPALVGALASPLSPPTARTLALPGWTEGLAVAWVLAGHLLAVWVAHAVAYRLFPSRLQAIRSQGALTGVMVFYTMWSLWIVTRPYAVPPFV